jgi:hypothetical protein
MFGSAQASKPTTGLFGSTTTTSAPQTGGLFGSTQQTQGGGLFGSSTANLRRNGRVVWINDYHNATTGWRTVWLDNIQLNHNWRTVWVYATTADWGTVRFDHYFSASASRRTLRINYGLPTPTDWWPLFESRATAAQNTGGGCSGRVLHNQSKVVECSVD